MTKATDYLRTWSALALCVACSLKTIARVFYLSYSKQRSHLDVFDQALRDWSQDLLRILQVSCTVHNPQQVAIQPGQNTIIMSNHTSLFDIPLLFTAFPANSIRMLAKKELFRIPLFGRAMKISGFPAVDRKDTRQALRDLEVVKQQMEQGIIPWIAPEGTRSRDGSLGGFKKGGFMLALQTGATIIPVGIRGAAGIIPPDTFQLHSGQQVSVHIQAPIHATDYSVETRQAFIDAVRASIATAMGAETTHDA